MVTGVSAQTKEGQCWPHTQYLHWLQYSTDTGPQPRTATPTANTDAAVNGHERTFLKAITQEQQK